MAGGAGLFQALYYNPGNPALPTLPTPGSATLGWSRSGFGSIADFTPRTRVRPLRTTGSGGSGSGFAGWYLDTVWTTPQPIDFASISADKSLEVTVHNTHRSPLELQGIELIEGLEVESPVLPRTIEPFSSEVVTLTAALAGPNTFDEVLEWTYDLETVDVQILGRRILLFAAQPESGVKEQLVFSTDIIRSKSGKEKAHSLRVAPRSVVRMSIRQSDDVARTTLHNLVLGGSPKLRIGRQSWWEARALTAAAPASANSVQFDTRYTSIRVGDVLVFAVPDGSFVDGEVLSLTDNSVTLTDAVGVSLPLGAYAMPVRFGRITRFPDLGVYPVNLEDMVVEFTTDDETDLGAVSEDEFDLHPIDGLPIIRANYIGRGEKPASISRRVQELDGVTGVAFSSGPEAMGEYGTQVLTVLQSSKAVFEWRQLLHHLRGSWGRFYLPTFQNDLPLASDLILGGAILDVRNVGIKRFIDGRAPRRDLRVVTSAGEVYYRRIASVTDNGATERIVLDTGIPGIGASPVAETIVGWLHLSRIQGDVATFTHERPGLAVLEFNARTVKE